MGFLDAVLDKERRIYRKMERSVAKLDDLLSSSDPDGEELLRQIVADVRDNLVNISKMKSKFAVLISKVSSSHLMLEKYSEAIDLANVAIQLDPEHADAHYSLAVSLRHSDDLDRAIEEIDRAIQLDIKQKHFWVEKGRILQSQGKPDAAYESYQEAIELDPKDVEVMNLQIELKPHDASLIGMKARTLMDQRRFSDALRAYEHAILQSPDDRDLWFGKAKRLMGIPERRSLCKRSTGFWQLIRTS